MEDYRKRFQELIRQMFQFDCADLDFGIYRIMAFKREAIERFIEKDLIEAIGKELSRGILAGDAKVAEELEDLAEKIREDFGEDALDGDGNLSEKPREVANSAGRIGAQIQKYLALRESASSAQAKPALEADIFNHLHAFFNRYYDAGDFISKRRYSRKEKYAIPYNGEEVHPPWANSDQYYVKTGEYFTDYRFNSRGISVHFRLQEADVPQNNVKGEKRLFVPLPKQSTFDAKACEIVIPFEFRPLTGAEQTRYGQKNQQDVIIAEAVDAILSALKKHNDALGALLASHHTAADGADVTFLAHHLRQYTRRNTSDFFIHKDLKGFLLRELDFYLKNEVLNLDELQAAGETRAAGWFQIMRVIKAIGGKIIEFLAQIEDFQKMLFEKRKFITDTQYCITVANIAETFHAEIAANDAQWAEWKELFHIDEEQKNLFTSAAKTKKNRRAAFLKAHPTLVLDTRNFDADFTDRLLASFDDLDEMTDGLLVKSENFQALGMLQEKYREKVDGIYIDPPYNTDAGPILYKNGFRHSSWLALIENSLRLTPGLLTSDGITCVTIDDCESHHLRILFESAFPQNDLLGVVAIKNNPAGRTGTVGFSICHEYAFFYGHPGAAKVGRLEHSDSQKARYKDEDELGFFEWTNFRKHGGVNTYRTTRPRQFYPIYVKGGRIRLPAMTWDNVARTYTVHEPPVQGEEVLLPLDAKGRERIWDFVVETTRKNIAHLRVRLDSAGHTALYRKWRINDEGLLPQTWWDKAEYSAVEYGTNLLTRMFGASHTFMFPKSVHAVVDCLKVAGLRHDQGGTVLDYYAGSGTTAHAITQMNRADGGFRKFLLVEMGEYFDTVLLPRIKKITFSPEWKDGKPVRQATAQEAERSPRIVKVIRLESYEDALNNIMLTGAAKTLYDFDDYMLQYMLKWEARESATLLNVDKLASPLSYRLRLVKGEQQDDRAVDVPETFAYLLGLHVKTRRVLEDKSPKKGKRCYVIYRGTVDHREVVVIWRDCAGWTKADFEQDKKYVVDQKLTDGADEVFVNGDSLIPGSQSLDAVFKARMFAGVQA